MVTAVAFTLTRAAGCLASTFHSRASLATMQAKLIHVPARLAHSARKLVLHLSKRWPWQPTWEHPTTAGRWIQAQSEAASFTLWGGPDPETRSVVRKRLRLTGGRC